MERAPQPARNPIVPTADHEQHTPGGPAVQRSARSRVQGRGGQPAGGVGPTIADTATCWSGRRTAWLAVWPSRSAFSSTAAQGPPLTSVSFMAADPPPPVPTPSAGAPLRCPDNPRSAAGRCRGWWPAGETLGSERSGLDP